jgi:nucleoid DNA-binding protein
MAGKADVVVVIAEHSSVSSHRKAREGRNPRSKAKITPPSKNTRFMASKDLRDTAALRMFANTYKKLG